MLSDIANKIQQSKFHWSDVALNIGIDKNDIFKIKRKNNSTLEFVNSVTQKIWDEILHFVGLNPSNNDFTEISSIVKLGAILSGNIEKEIHQEKHVKATSIEIENIQANKIGNETTKSDAESNNYDQCAEKKITNVPENNNQNVPVIHEISKRISQWRVFGRILNLEESFLNQLQTDCSLIAERNYKIIEKFSMPLQPNPSWMFWRQYLDGFDDGKLVIDEMEGKFIDLLPQIPNTVDHIVTSDQFTYVGHPFQYRGNKDYLTLDKENKLICVRIATKEYRFVHYQEFSEFIETQKHYYDTYNMLKDLKAINFVGDNLCPILRTLESYLDSENDSGFAMKGYNFVNHFCLFKQGVFAKEIFNDSYFCFLANDNMVLYLTKCSKGVCHALNHSLHNVQIANVLHGELQSNNITQINIIIRDESIDSKTFCRQCIDNDLFVNEQTFTDVEKFTLWYKNLIANNNIQKKINPTKDFMTGNEICNIKKDMITYEALEMSNLPSFSSCPEDQMDELKKLVVLSPNQFKALHSSKKHILLRGSYGSGKSLVLFKKFELIVNNMSDSEIVYFICNDQQSAFIKYMKILQTNYRMKNIIICRSDQLNNKTAIVPKLSYILNHIKHVWKDKTVHILIDEFSGSYFNNSEIEELKHILQNFQSSFIIIVLQSMEQHIVQIENKVFTDFGYQISILTKETSFTLFNLDYSLRNSSEINEFVKVTAEILESARVFVAEDQSFCTLGRSIDAESGMEYSNIDLDEESSIATAAYKYNQNESIGHAVKSGLVNVYHCGSKDLDETREIIIVYLSTLEYILKDLFEVKKYVICTYDGDVYNAIHHFLKTSLINWTFNVKEFMKTDSIFTVLLTDYAAVRGFEFSNFIFVSPLGNRYLKYKMLECFTRCTTRLHIISDERNVMNDSVDRQLIMKWKELDCVHFLDCSYEKSTDKVFLVHNDTEIYCKGNSMEIFNKPQTYVYRWNRVTKIEDIDFIDTIVEDDISIGLRCIVSMDNIHLFNYFIKLHNINIYSYRDNDDKNLLHVSSQYDAVCVSQILINDYQMDVNSTDNSESTPLHCAASYGSSNMVDILIKNGANVNVKMVAGDTPLYKCSDKGYANIVQLLLDNGADVNVMNWRIETPLHISSTKGYINIAQVLLNNGADVNVKNENGRTAITLAEQYNHHDIVELLKRYK